MSLLRMGLIGANISRTRLPMALDIMCADHGMTLEFTPIDTDEIADFDFTSCVESLIAKGWNGVTVTHPFKTRAAAFAGDGMDASVAHLGAANTLVFGESVTGWNTDYLGFLAAWRHVFGDRAPGRVAIAGAGGVARALAPALSVLGAEEIAIWDPAPGMAEALAEITGAKARVIDMKDRRDAIRSATGLVNASALGMGGHPGSAFDAGLIGPQDWAFDAVYTPTDTEFLQACAARGLSLLTGFDLFRFMAMETFRTYTGHAPDPGTTLAKLDALRPKETTA